MEEKTQGKLSEGVLHMKFMKRTKERVEKEKSEAEGQAMYSNDISEEMRRSGNIVFIETSITNCKDLIDGRMSFGGMNPGVENLMTKYMEKLKEVEHKNEKDITDFEMADGYSSVMKTVSKKFQNKRKRNKRNFLKPSEDF